jgi:hypothetical protein
MIFARRFAVAFVVVLFATAAFAQSKGGKNPLQGVWKVTEATTTGNNAQHVQNPRPSVYIFTEKYYSFQAEQGDKARPDLGTATASATADQLRTSWGPFQANSGTYEVKGSEVTVHRLVAKAPENMKAGSFTTFTFKVEGNTVTLVNKANQDGPVANPTTLKLTRVE